MNIVIKAIEDIKNGKMVIVVDHEDRENEGDFIISAEKATADDINFMMKYGRGLICTSISSERAKKMNLNLMVDNNTEHQKTNFTISVDARDGITTGISAPPIGIINKIPTKNEIKIIVQNKESVCILHK